MVSMSMLRTPGTCLRMSGFTTDTIWGIVRDAEGWGPGKLYAKCYSPKCPDGESGTVNERQITPVTFEELRRNVEQIVREGLISKPFQEAALSHLDDIARETRDNPAENA